MKDIKTVLVGLILAFVLLLGTGCNTVAHVDSTLDSTSYTDTQTESIENTDTAEPIYPIFPTDTEYNIQKMLNEIYAVDETLCATDEEKREKNLIDARIVRSTDPNVPEFIKKEILGKEYNLTYVETQTYPLYGEVADKYALEGFGENGSIIIRRDGSIRSLLFDFTNISISGIEPPQVIKPQLEAEIYEIVDVSNYEYCDLPEYVPEKESFGSYHFLYYNMEKGYITDFMHVFVKDDGTIKSLTINDIDIGVEFDLSNVRINKDLEDKLLSAKTKQIYENARKECVGCERVEYMLPNICFYEGKFFIQYNVSAIYLEQNGQQQSSGYIQRILIPLHILINYPE